MSLLEEFWYGSIEPEEYNGSRCEAYWKVLERITSNEKKLLATMTDEQEELYSQHTDCVLEYQALAECLLFQSSFKLGVRMVLEVMEE